MIKSYIKKDNVIKCELDLIFIKKSIYYLIFTDHYREDVDKLSQIAVAKTLCWENDYSISKTTRNWTNLSLINDFVRSSTIIWSIDT
jgi:hypothetical protein